MESPYMIVSPCGGSFPLHGFFAFLGHVNAHQKCKIRRYPLVRGTPPQRPRRGYAGFWRLTVQLGTKAIYGFERVKNDEKTVFIADVSVIIKIDAEALSMTSFYISPIAVRERKLRTGLLVIRFLPHLSFLTAVTAAIAVFLCR